MNEWFKGGENERGKQCRRVCPWGGRGDGLEMIIAAELLFPVVKERGWTRLSLCARPMVGALGAANCAKER